MADILGEIAGYLYGIYELGKGIFDAVSSDADIIASGATEIIGFGDAVKAPIQTSTGFLAAIFPSDIVTMFAIAFTVIVALATRRSVNA